MVTLVETRVFTEPFESKYQALKQDWDYEARSTYEFVNSLSPGTKEVDAPRPPSLLKAGRLGSFSKEDSKDFNLTAVVDGIFKSFESNPKSADFFKNRDRNAKISQSILRL